MKTLIIYFSADGSTKIMARTLSMNLKADIIEIKDLKNREGFLNRLVSSVDAFRESKTKISPPKIDLSNYDLIYIGTPTWANKPAPAIITLIDNCDWQGKDVILFLSELGVCAKIWHGRKLNEYGMEFGKYLSGI